MRTITSMELSADPAAGLRAATEGPVYITEDGAITHVLLSAEDYRRTVPFGDEVEPARETPLGQLEDRGQSDESGSSAIRKSAAKPFRIGMLNGVVSPPPDDFLQPMTEEELRDWECGSDDEDKS